MKRRLFFLFTFLFLFLMQCQKQKPSLSKHTYLPQEEKYIALAKAFDQKDQIDSAYHYYSLLMEFQLMRHDTLEAAKTNINLMVLDYKMNDFPSTEKRCTEAIAFGLRHQDYFKVCDGYNFLGLSAYEQRNYTEAIEYYTLMRQYYPQLTPDTMLYYLNYQTNIGNVYHEMKKYDAALTTYDAIMHVDSILIYGPEDYARALDNKAKTLMESNPEYDVLPLLTRAMHLRDSIHIPSGLITSYLHLSEYYLNTKQPLQAATYAQQSLALCREIHNVNDELQSLVLWSKADPTHADVALFRYAELRDSLLFVERTFEDQVARIRFKTREKEATIAQQEHIIHRRNQYLITGSLFFLVLSIGAFFIWKQKQRIALQKSQLEAQVVQIRSLQREMHHRIKNSLEKVVMYIGMQTNTMGTVAVDLTNKVKSMLFIHQQLLEHPSDTDIVMASYLEKIVQNTLQAYDATRHVAYVDTQVILSDKHAVKLGGIVTELVTNSVKYAYEPTDIGNLSLQLTLAGSSLRLVYADDGRGLNSERLAGKETSHGMQTIKGIVEKEYKGRFTLENREERGLLFTLIFQLPTIET